jgi:CheY-like chemotaxis protein
VIEDDPAYCRLVKRMLEAAGYSVATAPDYIEGLAIVEGTEPPDLLLTDVNLPTGTPHGISIGMMAMRKRRELKVVYMTGEHDPKKLAHLTDTAPILRKPFTSGEMVEAIKKALG